MKITKAQIKKIIREEVTKALREDASDDTFDMVDAIVQVLGPQQALEELVQAMERSNAQELLGYIMQNHEIRMAGDEVEDYDPNDFPDDSPRYETSAEADLAKFQKDRFGKEGDHASTMMADYASDYRD